MQDEQLRNLLADAEVKTPRRVWRNISSRLDEAAPVSSPYGWMKWAGAALAVAAVVLGVFLLTPGTSENPIPTYSNITEAPVAQASPVMDEPEPEVLTTAEGQSAPAPARRRTAPVRAAEPVFAEAAPVEVIASAEDEAEPAVQDAAPAEETHKTAARRTAPVRTSPFVDPFAAMAYEDSRAFKPHAKALYAQGSIGGNDSDISFAANRARMASGTAVEKTGIKELGESVYGIPFSLGVGVRFYVLPKLSFGTGLSYSLLSRTFDGQYQRVNGMGAVEFSEKGQVHHTMHYIGIPVNAYYDIISGNKVRFYVYGGGEAEYCVSNKYTLYSATDIVYRSAVNKLQWSVGAGLGVEFRLSDHLGLYLDPSARYYFHCDQPKNVRTERPLMANFDAGLRFDF